MKYLALATDYDGTIAAHGHVTDATLAGLDRWRETGRKLLLVTGRELPELAAIFKPLHIFDRVVAENGAVLLRPDTGELKQLATPPPAKFAEILRERGVTDLSVGQVIVATHEKFSAVILQTIQDLGLELQIIFNKGSAMILPTGVNKATGLRFALKELQLSPEQTVGVGDAENDHSFLSLCGWSAAVANALPALKVEVDYVCAQPDGPGVVELVDSLLRTDLAPAPTPPPL